MSEYNSSKDYANYALEMSDPEKELSHRADIQEEKTETTLLMDALAKERKESTQQIIALKEQVAALQETVTAEVSKIPRGVHFGLRKTMHLMGEQLVSIMQMIETMDKFTSTMTKDLEKTISKIGSDLTKHFEGNLDGSVKKIKADLRELDDKIVEEKDSIARSKKTRNTLLTINAILLALSIILSIIF